MPKKGAKRVTTSPSIARLAALDAMAASVMLADTDLDITYMNQGVKALLKEAQDELRKALPDFSVDGLIGRNIDAFHKDPSRQRAMLERLSTVHRATIRIGSRAFDLIATPLFDAKGKRIGTAVEWMSAEARLQNADYAAEIAAIGRSQAVIEFDLDGTIRTANANFLRTVGYALDEIKGKHHSLFVEPAYRESAEYHAFWAKLGRGEYDEAQYKRIGKGGKEVWLQASYNPIFDPNGKPFKVVKYATDITERKLRMADYEGQISAISKAQAVIEFALDGTILTANDNFLHTVGYTLDEVKGKHHGLFVDAAYRESAEYRAFWAKLGRGEYEAAQYKRIAKGGREVWLQASYNPIFDAAAEPTRSSSTRPM